MVDDKAKQEIIQRAMTLLAKAVHNDQDHERIVALNLVAKLLSANSLSVGDIAAPPGSMSHYLNFLDKLQKRLERVERENYYWRRAAPKMARDAEKAGLIPYVADEFMSEVEIRFGDASGRLDKKGRWENAVCEALRISKRTLTNWRLGSEPIPEEMIEKLREMPPRPRTNDDWRNPDVLTRVFDLFTQGYTKVKIANAVGHTPPEVFAQTYKKPPPDWYVRDIRDNGQPTDWKELWKLGGTVWETDRPNPVLTRHGMSAANTSSWITPCKTFLEWTGSTSQGLDGDPNQFTTMGRIDALRDLYRETIKERNNDTPKKSKTKAKPKTMATERDHYNWRANKTNVEKSEDMARRGCSPEDILALDGWNPPLDPINDLKRVKQKFFSRPSNKATEKIISLLRDHPEGLATDEIMRKTGKAKGTVERDLPQMRTHGLIRSDRRDNKTIWML